MSRPSWWPWLDAVRSSVTDEGAFTTAVVWAQLCWSWRGGEYADATRAGPAALAQLVAAHPGDIGEQQVRRRLKLLQEAGVLELIRRHSPASPNVFAPSLPNITGHDVPVITGHDVPVIDGDTGHLRQEHRSPEAPPLFSPERPENPPARERGRAGARARTPGGITTSDPEGVAAFELLARAMAYRWGEGTPRRITDDYRRRAVVQLAWLRRGGWPAETLADRLNAREWSTAGSVGRALLARLADLREEPPPQTSRDRHTERLERAAVRPCDHLTPGGCSACFMCRRGKADEDGTFCTQCAPLSVDGLAPAGFTPPLIPRLKGPDHPTQHLITQPEGSTNHE